MLPQNKKIVVCVLRGELGGCSYAFFKKRYYITLQTVDALRLYRKGGIYIS